jgi:hypothetical protein
MELLLKSKDIIAEIRRKVESKDPSLFEHHEINARELPDNTISIVMTSSNRSKQTYFTLQSISNSSHKNVHVVLVDDSDVDHVDITKLSTNFGFYIDFIRIKRENKNWVNPVVNYNIGFKFIKGSKVVIQNAEVCHIGDPLSLINVGVEHDKYYVFDVNASKSLADNEKIYTKDIRNIENIKSPEIKWMCWYQHSEKRNRFLHFFTALTRQTFEKIKEFSYDYTMGKDFDDDDFVLKVKSNNISFFNIVYKTQKCMGIHLFHQNAYQGYCKDKVSNKPIFDYKTKMWKDTQKYISILDTESI